MESDKNRVRKSFLGVLVFGHPYCSSRNNTEFKAEYENTCQFPCHIGSSILTFRDMYAHVVVRIHHIYVYQIHKKQQL